MRLPHLDQVIELERGEAGQFYMALAYAWKQRMDALGDYPTGRLLAGEVLAIAVLERAGKRLHRLVEAEQLHQGRPRHKPRRFRLSVDELVAIMCCVFPQAGFQSHVVLGKVQQVSLNLEHLLKF